MSFTQGESKCCESERNRWDVAVDLLKRAKFRIKIKSLAEESRIIRAEERRRSSERDMKKYGTDIRGLLRWHRVDMVRHESRATLLAYAFWRGRPYASVESNPLSAAKVARRVADIVKSLTIDRPTTQDILAWITEGK